MSIISLDYSEIIDGKVHNKKLEFSKYLLKEPYKLESLFVSKVEGKSMQPVINDEALVVADLSQNQFISDNIFLVYCENRMWIKKSTLINGVEHFVSINSDYSHLVYKRDDVRIIAKVLLTFTNF